jgi:hypothetical protein
LAGALVDAPEAAGGLSVVCAWTPDGTPCAMIKAVSFRAEQADEEFLGGMAVYGF